MRSEEWWVNSQQTRCKVFVKSLEDDAFLEIYEFLCGYNFLGEVTFKRTLPLDSRNRGAHCGSGGAGCAPISLEPGSQRSDRNPHGGGLADIDKRISPGSVSRALQRLLCFPVRYGTRFRSGSRTLHPKFPGMAQDGATCGPGARRFSMA